MCRGSVSIKIVSSFVVLIFLAGSPAATTNITIITVIIGQNPMYGYYSSGPVFEVAFDTVLQAYPQLAPNIHRHMIYSDKGIVGCGDTGDMMPAMAGEVVRIVSQTKGFTLLLSPGCSLEMITLGDFARELDVPLLTSTSADQALSNRKRYPTLTTFSSAGQGQCSRAIREFLRKFAWTTVTVLCDDLSLFPSAATMYIVACRGFKSVLTEFPGEFQMFYEQFDSRNNPNFKTILTRAKSQSRVLLVGTNADIMRNILVTASKLNMTGRDYVWLYQQSIQVPETSELTWKMNSTADKTVFEALQSVIVIRFPPPDWESLTNYSISVGEVSRRHFNFTYPPDYYNNDITLSAFEAVLAGFEVLNESQTNLDFTSGREFSKKFVSRTFDFGFRSTVIGPNGMRNRDTHFLKFNVAIGEFEVAWYHTWTNNSITDVSSQAHSWFRSDTFPSNTPACGFRDDQCSPPLSVTFPIVGAVLFVIIVAAAVGIPLGYWKYVRHQERYSIWWNLSSSLLVITNPNPTTGLIKSSRASRLSGASQNIFRLPAKPREPVVTFDSRRVWAYTVDIATTTGALTANSEFRHILADMKSISQDNAGTLTGVVVSPEQLSFLWPYGRGCLRQLLDDKANLLNQKIQLRLMHEILAGLSYLHASRLKCHGSLSSLSTLLDNRFAVKLSGYASKRLLSSVGYQSIVANRMELLWDAPEQHAGASKEGSRIADIFSFGIVMGEIMTGLTPYRMNLKDSVEIEEMLPKLASRTRISPFKPNDMGPLPEKIRTIMAGCIAFDDMERPSLHTIASRLKTFDSGVSIVDDILTRLQAYSAQLEAMVASRAHELLAETQKVDSLLGEMIPSIYVSKLRNKEPIPVEHYKLVTVFFSTLVGFDTYCASSLPQDVVTLLNTVYFTFDQTILQHDVYKIETIKDSYMVASGLPIRNGYRHGKEIADTALDLLAVWHSSVLLLHTRTKTSLEVRIGIHSGPCAAGVVGTRMPRYCLFGDTINTASRMESHGEASRIHLSSSTEKLLRSVGSFDIEPRGTVNIKGKTAMMTFWLTGHSTEAA
ncbi:atrial natriuretic peptide receptor 1-like [Paramacrobiotus metropolitanus]|uniref:atrial natriuretic peptide receptor 1-like n=1 Tax=Paramacrobiotus metropolitanus TaxID=2943436 RepID=UPI002445B04E|nr:atrial natriuretic peptide receptor 1-like [Paramacrobiotus metropolitanus]